MDDSEAGQPRQDHQVERRPAQLAVDETRDRLRSALGDASPTVRIIAAQALGQYGNETDLALALPVLKELAPPDKNGAYVSLLDLNALDALGNKAAPLMETLTKMPTQDPSAAARANSYVARLVEYLTETSNSGAPTAKKRTGKKKQ